MFIIEHLKLLMKYGSDDKIIQEYTRPKVLKLYRNWMKELTTTLPFGIREVNRELVRAYFKEGKEDWYLWTIFKELECGEYALNEYRKGERNYLKYGVMRRFNFYWYNHPQEFVLNFQIREKGRIYNPLYYRQ